MNPKIIYVLAATLLSVGCSTFDQVDQVERNADARFEESTKAAKQAREAKAPARRDTVVYLDEPWVSLKPIAAAPERDDPVVKCKLKVASGEPMSLLELGQTVTRLCGIPVRITPDALNAIDNSPGDPNSPSTAPTGPTPVVPGVMTPGIQRSTETPTEARLIEVNYQGELPGLLDMVVSRFGLSWRFEDGRIKVFAVDTMTFHLHAIATSTDASSSVASGTTMLNGTSSGSGSGGGTSGVGGSSSSAQNTNVSLKTSIWADVKTTLETMKSARGRISIAPATGTVTVTDTSEVLDKVAAYIRRENEWLTKQVLFRIQVLSVIANNSDSMSISWNAVWNSVSQRYGFAASGAIGAVQSGANTAFSILSGSTSPWAGTEAIISALNEQGRVITVREPTASTLNLQAVSVQVASQKGYLAGQTTSTVANVGTTTTNTTGIVTTGFNMSLLPYVIEDDRLLLLFSVNLSSLQNIRTVGSGASAVEVPEIALPINSTQQVRLKAGDTLVLSGFDQEDGASTRTGNGNPHNWVMGGGLRGSSGRSTLVVMITPVILE